jgi:carboxymethylenebutenolidase
VTFLVASRRTLGAAVGFYGGGIAAAGGLPFAPLIGESSTLQTPWLGLFGDQDKGISVESVEELRTALEQAPVDADIVRYADAEHGFHCDARASYHAESAADGWRRTLAWFAGHLG